MLVGFESFFMVVLFVFQNFKIEEQKALSPGAFQIHSINANGSFHQCDVSVTLNRAQYQFQVSLSSLCASYSCINFNNSKNDSPVKLFLSHRLKKGCMTAKELDE